MNEEDIGKLPWARKRPTGTWGELDGRELFEQALAEHGLNPPQIIADGRIHRFGTNHDKPGHYCLHEDDDRYWGWYGDWSRSDQVLTFKSFSENILSPAERELHDRRIAEDRRIYEEENRQRVEAGKQKAKEELAEMKPAPADFPYFAKKNIGPVHMVCYSAREECYCQRQEKHDDGQGNRRACNGPE